MQDCSQIRAFIRHRKMAMLRRDLEQRMKALRLFGPRYGERSTSLEGEPAGLVGKPWM
jgi:hypothetical protein